jgi:hypothetical protein
MKDEPREMRELLSRLPNAPVPSNFTARVMQAIEVDELQAGRRRGWFWNWHVLLPRVAVAAVVVVASGLALHQHEISSRRIALAQSVALMASAQPMPSVEALNNFDAIQRMGEPAHADEELLALLQ